ncbi:myb-binding protein 1A [Drosophila nasuta]|uniref:myb-binding protein 1A n=1 Tax=Drosophila nasuta TaxID=42062 RepID=UPI00295EE232|nr:myb-binding protein 1A [Drosophila nasuta]
MANSKTKLANGGKKRKPQAEKENQKPQHNETELPAKKAKGEVKNETEDAAPNNAVKKIDASHINKGIFKIFAKLQETSKLANVDKHVGEMIALLTNETDDDARLATCAYALKRLVRCTGADDMQSVALSACQIHRILRQVPHIDPLELLATLKRELHVSSQSKAKEESLAGVGQLITVMAILQSQHFEKPSKELIEQIYPLLISNLKGREYLVNMCVDIMTESFQQLSPKLFEAHVWPLLQLELNKPLSALKLPQCDLLLAIHLLYPKLLSRKQLESSLWRNQPQYAQLFDLYLNNSAKPSDDVCTRLAKFLSHKANGELYKTFVQHVESQLPLRHNTAKGFVIRTLAYVLIHSADGNSELFSPSLIQMLIQELATARQLKPSEKVKPSQLQLREICLEFEQTLLLSFEHHLQQDASKVKLLRSLLDVELQLDSVTQTPRITSQLLGQLNAEGVKEMLQFYSQKLINANEELYKMHGEHCLKQLQQLLFNPKLTEPKEHLNLILLTASFHVNESGVACEPKKASAFSRQSAARCEEILYSYLLRKPSKSVDLLTTLVDRLRSTLQALNVLLEQQDESKVRAKLTPELKQAWLKIKQLLLNEKANSKSTTSSISSAFDALILCLGLSIYTPNCSAPIELLNDLFICKENALKATKKKGKEEMKWQDVLTDLLLQLLVQKGHFWRELVNAAGGALMPQLNRDNLEQLLVVLDMSKNPLGDKEDDDDAEGDEEADDDEDEDEQSSDDEDDDNDDDEEDDDAEEEDDEEEDDDEEGATNLELIRENVRKALLAENNNDGDDDMNDASSVDWNDVDEAEGERLNLALEQAFQSFKPKGGSGGQGKKAKNKQQTKSERINATTLLHFRVRVLDLVELYIQKQPEMESLLDALISVFYVYEFCSNSADKSQQSLAEASKKLLRKFLNQKMSFDSSQSIDKQAIVDAIELFIKPEQVEDPKKSQKQQQKQQPINAKKKGDVAEWRNKCVAYLVSQFDESDVTKTPVWSLLQCYLADWAERRNSPHSLASFDAILQSQWKGIPQLAASLAALLKGKLRNFRRQQILELLVKHSRRIANALTKEQRDELIDTLTNYTAVGQKDGNLRTKLLKQLQPNK